jgi:hypothetical protein
MKIVTPFYINYSKLKFERKMKVNKKCGKEGMMEDQMNSSINIEI